MAAHAWDKETDKETCTHSGNVSINDKLTAGLVQ